MMSQPLILSIAAVASWILLCWYCLIGPRRRPQTTSAASGEAQASASIAIIYASQTGTAIELAQNAAQAFGARAVLSAMDEITPSQLAQYGQALFIVSTYGEGDPPDMAQAFYSQMQSNTANHGLAHLQAGVLALGDSSYANFCGFGLCLDDWLHKQGVALLFDTVTVDRNSTQALQQWSDCLARVFGVRLKSHAQPQRWLLSRQRVLNPASQGLPCHELQWQAQDTPAPTWQAGDIAQVQIGTSDQHREYSIASLPSDGILRLLVREHRLPDGKPGFGSHWLTSELAPGDEALIHLRPNPLFKVPDDDRPALFIGNGTGIAGLRALLQERIARGHHENWLMFGERQLSHDFHWGEQFETWLQQGKIQRLDLSFSRDQAEKRYVHHLLHASCEMVRDWVARGAVIYVCGSKTGMAQNVDETLNAILGPHGYHALQQRRGYCRDVY